jgi:hypothetical protein
MHVQITTATLALLTVLMILLRVFWLRIPVALRTFIIWFAVSSFVLRVVFVLTKTGTDSDYLNAALSWFAVGAYELFILLFTLLPPNWLTSISAAILLVPVFAASVLTPLTHLFEPPDKVVSLGNHFFSNQTFWHEGPSTNSGVELNVFSKPRFAPFLRRYRLHVIFNNVQCNTAASYAIIQPDNKSVLFRCPLWPSQQGPGPVEELMSLP